MLKYLLEKKKKEILQNNLRNKLINIQLKLNNETIINCTK